MNRALPYAALILALTALGCGGSSVVPPTTPPATAGLSAPQIEGQVLSSTNVIPTTPVVEDTRNIQTGELILFEVVAYDAAGGRHVLTPSGPWYWSDSVNQFGTLDGSSGLFLVGQVPTSSLQIINVPYNGGTLAAYYQVNPYQARIIGQVVGSDTNKGLRGVGITFYTSTNTVDGYCLSSYDGTFRASVKTDCVKFSVDPTTESAGYWQSFTYGSNPAYATDPTQAPLLTFDAGSNACDAYFQTLYRRDGSQIGTSLTVGENFLFSPTQPSTLLTPVTPANASDPSLIIVNARSTYPSRPSSNGCSG